MKKLFYDAIKIVLGGIYTGLIIVVATGDNFVSDAGWKLTVLAILAVIFLTIIFWIVSKILKIDN